MSLYAAPALPPRTRVPGLARRRRYSAGRSAGAIIADRPSTRHVTSMVCASTRRFDRRSERTRGSAGHLCCRARWRPGGRPTPSRRKMPPNLVAVTCCFGWEIWSGRRDSNPRPQPWQGCALPLSYTRSRGTEPQVAPIWPKRDLIATGKSGAAGHALSRCRHAKMCRACARSISALPALRCAGQGAMRPRRNRRP